MTDQLALDASGPEPMVLERGDLVLQSKLDGSITLGREVEALHLSVDELRWLMVAVPALALHVAPLRLYAVPSDEDIVNHAHAERAAEALEFEGER